MSTRTLRKIKRHLAIALDACEKLRETEERKGRADENEMEEIEYLAAQVEDGLSVVKDLLT